MDKNTIWAIVLSTLVIVGFFMVSGAKNALEEAAGRYYTVTVWFYHSVGLGRFHYV